MNKVPKKHINLCYIEIWKTYMDMIKDNNGKRFNANLTFVAAATASFYFMYKDGMKVSFPFFICILVCAVGWILTIISLKKKNKEIYIKIGRIERKMGINLEYDSRMTQSFLPYICSNYEYLFPLLLVSITAYFCFAR